MEVHPGRGTINGGMKQMNYTKLYKQYLDEAKSRGYFKSRMLGRKDFAAKLEVRVSYGSTPDEAIKALVDQKGRTIDAWKNLYDYAREHDTEGKDGKIGKIEARNLIYGDYNTIMDRFGGYVSSYYDELMEKAGMTSTEAGKIISRDIFGS